MVQPGKAVRPLQPKNNGNNDADARLSAGGPSPAEHKPAKRRCVVSTACIPCRKRKSKCDGSVPVCSTCVAVYRTECSYDADIDPRRKTNVKRDSSSLQDHSDAATYIVNYLKTCSESEATELLYQLKSEDNLDTLVEGLRRTVQIPQKSTSKSLEGDYSYLTGKELTNDAGQTKHYGHTSNLGLVDTEDVSSLFKVSTPPQIQGKEGWTTVTSDVAFVEHLLKLYFTWQTFYVFLSEKKFLHDFQHGNTTYCSSLLVNAICAYACHFSDMPAARTNPDDPRTAGDHFFKEARELLYKNEYSCLTTCQALAVMSLREASAAREESGFQYAGRYMRMAIALGLHLPVAEGWREQLSAAEIEARTWTFWGLFTSDTAWSVCIGRISQLPRGAISVAKPSEGSVIEKWYPYTDEDYGHPQPRAEFESDTLQFFLRLSSLSEIVTDVIYIFYAPRDRLTSRRLHDRYQKYEAWYRTLPPTLKEVTEKSAPNIYVLHMYYWTCVLHLFRPFLEYKLSGSDLVPRDMCVRAAKEIRMMMDRYREHFGLRRSNLLITNPLMTACTVHLLDLPNKDRITQHKTLIQAQAEENIRKGLRDLAEMSTNHHFAARSYKVICGLAQKWGKVIPPDAFHDIAPCLRSYIPPTPTMSNESRDSTTPATISAPILDNVGTPASGSIQLTLNESSRFSRTQSTENISVHDVSQASSASYSNPAVITSYSSLSGPMMLNAYPSISPMSPTTKFPRISLASTQPTPSPSTRPTAGSHQTSAPTAVYRPDIFWNPIPGQGIPLIGSNNVFDPMAVPVSNMLGQIDESEQFYQDGFVKVDDSGHSSSGTFMAAPTEFGSQSVGAPPNSPQHMKAEWHQNQHAYMDGIQASRQKLPSQLLPPQSWHGNR